MHDNFDKKRITSLYYCQRFENVYKTLTNVTEAYFLSSNRASNITTFKVIVFKFLI